MMNKACFVLMVAMSSASLFGGETMVTHHYRTVRTGCDFRVDNCQTSVAVDPDYARFKDGVTPLAPAGTGSAGVPTPYDTAYTFVDYSSPLQPGVGDLAEIIRENLSNCPEVTIHYDVNTGYITLHYRSTETPEWVTDHRYRRTEYTNDCDWTVNVRNVKAEDFVWNRTSDNYSMYLGQMERLKFHTPSAQNAQNIELACKQTCKLNNWEIIQ